MSCASWCQVEEWIRTDHSDCAETLAGAGSILHSDAVVAAVLSLGPVDGEAKVASGAVKANLLIRFQFFVVLGPGDGGSWFAAKAARQRTAVAHFDHHLLPDVHVQSWWLCKNNQSDNFFFFFCRLVVISKKNI